MRSGSSEIAQLWWRCASVAIAVAALGVFGVQSASGQCMYEVQVVTGPPCFPDPNISIGLEGINDLGQACGWQAICGQTGFLRPIVWTPELGIVVLPLPQGAERGVANDINNVIGSDGFGQVVCTLQGSGLGGDKAFLYDDGQWTNLGLLPGASVARGFAINDHTEIAGECHNTVSGPFQAFVWRNGTMSGLDLPLGPHSSAGDINEHSIIVGWMGPSSSSNDGFITDRVMIDFVPLLPNATTSEPVAVNESDTVTGSGRIPVKSGPIARRSWMYQSRRLTDLDGFKDTHRNSAEDINDIGQIVGSSFSLPGGSGETSFLWQDGELIRLDDLIELPPELSGLAAVKAINNKGQIAGRAGSAAGCCSRGVILTPLAPLGDVDLNCEVNGWDLALVLGNWGPCNSAGSCIADCVSSDTFQPPGDGVVDGADLAVVLGNWTDSSPTSLPYRR